MPVTPTYPGVYIEEVPSGVRTITGVATSVTAFIGRAKRGPVDDATTINSFGDFERIFGGIWVESSLGYAVRDFYLNGGSQAIIVRLYQPADEDDGIASITVDELTLAAANPGTWGQYLRVTVDRNNSADVATALGLGSAADLFNLTVREDVPGGPVEQFRNLSVAESPRRIDRVLAAESQLLRWRGDWPAESPAIPAAAALTTAQGQVTTAQTNLQQARQQLSDAQAAQPPDQAAIDAARAAVAAAQTAATNANTALAGVSDSDPVTDAAAALSAAKNAKPPVPADITAAEAALQAALEAVGGSDGDPLTMADSFTPDGSRNDKRGLYALEQADLFNLLCIPPYLVTGDVDVALVSAAASYCEERRAMLIVDPPSGWKNKTIARDQFTDPSQDNVGTRSKNAALFFPRLVQPNPKRDNQMEEFAPCGVIAGIFARTDTQRGVWKAPAGLEATLVGVPKLSVLLTDAENGELNPLGINCLRSLPGAGRVVWGARTLQGNAQLASEHKYIPVRRTTLFIEESLYRGLQWVVFEPNDEPLWAQIRLNVGAFMQGLFRQGAFQGSSPREAYFVKCDKETTTQADINLGIVNVIVGFAPLKPAEFVIVKIQQMAGQIQV